MRITFTTPNGEMVTLDLAEDMELENVKALCEYDLKIPAINMVISVNGQALTDDKKTLTAVGLKDGDVVLVLPAISNRPAAAAASPRPQPAAGGGGGGPTPSKIPKIDFSTISVAPGGTSRPSGSRQAQSSVAGTSGQAAAAAELRQAQLYAEQTRSQLESDPDAMEKITKESPELLAAILKADGSAVLEYLKKQRLEAARKMQMLYSNPDSAEAQQLMLEQIRQQAIQDNLEYALEHTPESMGSVQMLYVNCSVNGKQMKAFVDSGAQISIISREYAELCNIAHLIDERMQGMAVGVGTQRFAGKIHACQMEIGGAHLTTSFNVLEQGNMQILLGLDMLRRHQMVIDLKRNVLVVGTTNTEAHFLSEAEIPTNGLGKDRDMAFIPNETDIEALVAMGFSREQARAALIKFEGNKDQAASELLTKPGTNAGGATGSQ
ncbi:Protein DDI1-like protein 2 [Hypsibius exemplaris]|uniref:Protein DDI1-like protein 2 n=1 Tax=Hypsibius exemplaris TaxID=2072580 RepID=A0A1W0X8S4_HYPEX|nr:Protein DDI1-like protein 2 [Hypsibius exemplaris]